MENQAPSFLDRLIFRQTPETRDHWGGPRYYPSFVGGLVYKRHFSVHFALTVLEAWARALAAERNIFGSSSSGVRRSRSQEFLGLSSTPESDTRTESMSFRKPVLTQDKLQTVFAELREAIKEEGNEKMRYEQQRKNEATQLEVETEQKIQEVVAAEEELLRKYFSEDGNKSVQSNGAAPNAV